MKICLQCNAEITGDTWKCDKCAWAPINIEGITLFAPDISGVGESYDPAWYEELATLENDNFWFVSRNRVIKWLTGRYCNKPGKYLEIGCGTGFVLQMLEKTFPEWEIYATEAQLEGLHLARQRVTTRTKLFQMDACAIPFRNEFDVVGAFDVIEHIRDDRKAIHEIYQSLKPGGLFVLSVPQHMFLWSKFDELGCHFRRYAVNEIETVLKSCGFSVLLSTSFNSLLLPLMVVSRWFKKTDENNSIDVLDELRIPNSLNKILELILYIEYLLVKTGIRFPIGGSRMIVAKKH